jgi:hypothetical protein
MSEYVDLLTKKIPSTKKTSSRRSSRRSSRPSPKTSSRPSAKTSSSSGIQKLSIDMTPYLYKYKKYKKSRISKKSRRCKNKFIMNSIFIKKNIISICEYIIYILLFVLLFYLFKKN